MIAYFWTYAKEYNSTARPDNANATEKVIELKAPTDIINPVLTMRGDYDTAYNYCYIPTLHRYYKINSARWISGLWEIACMVDVLASWRDYIGQQNLYVLRSSHTWDVDIIDNMYPAQSEVVTSHSDFSGLWDFSGYYIIGVINRTGGTSYYRLTPSEFRTFCATVFGDMFFSLVKGESELIKAQFNPMQYLSSCMWFPFASGGGGRAESISLGWWDTGISGIKVPLGNQVNSTFTLSVPKHPQAASRGKYLNMSPYSDYVLDLRPFGRIPLDPKILYNVESITCNIAIDSIIGAGVLSLLIDGGRQVLASAQVGVSVQVGQISHDYIGAATSAIGGVASMVAGGVAGIITGVSALGNALNSAMGQVSAQGVNGGMGMLYGDQQLVANFYQIVDEDMSHKGRPLCQKKTISDIPGFVMCSDADIKIPAMEPEQEQLRTLLEEGIIYV